MKNRNDRNIYIKLNLYNRYYIYIPFIWIVIFLADIITSDLVLLVCQYRSEMIYAIVNIYQCHANVRFD